MTEHETRRRILRKLERTIKERQTMKHTERNWKVSGKPMLVDRGGGLIDWRAQVSDDNHKLITSVYSGSPEEAESIARLFAAAPKLLESLIRIVEFTGAHGGPYAEARAIIAKATGETT